MRQAGRLPPGSVNLKASPRWHRTSNVSQEKHGLLGSHTSEAVLSQLNVKKHAFFGDLDKPNPQVLRTMEHTSVPAIVPTLQHVSHSGVTETRLASYYIISWDLRQCTEPVRVTYNWTVCWRAGAWDVRRGQEGKRYSTQKLEASKASRK